MMIYLYITLAAVLAAASVWFLARPLARGAHVESRERYFQLLVVRDRLLAQLNELDLDEGDRSMEADTAADERARLEGEFAAVLQKLDALAPETGDDKEARPKKSWRWVVVALAVIVPVLATGAYLINVTVPPTELDAVAALPQGVPPQALKMVERLEKRLKENPADPEGWLKLGHSYVVLGRLEDARLAYDGAYRVLPQNFEPDNGEAYWFLGLAAYNRGEFKRAIGMWQKLLAAMPPDSETAKQLKAAIGQARERDQKK